MDNSVAFCLFINHTVLGYWISDQISYVYISVSNLNLIADRNLN